MLLQNSSSEKRRIFVDWILQGNEAARSDGERFTRLLSEILGSYPDPFVLRMRNGDQRASKISSSGQTGVLQENWRSRVAWVGRAKATIVERGDHSVIIDGSRAVARGRH